VKAMNDRVLARLFAISSIEAPATLVMHDSVIFLSIDFPEFNDEMIAESLIA